MHSRPDANDLLGIAHDTLLQKLLPALPENLRYDARMIASAIAIALREIALAEATEKNEWEALTNLLNEPVWDTAECQTGLPSGLNQARRKLSNAIREG